MSVKISLPNQILLSEDGEEVSQHRSPEEAMESASNNPGKYRLVRPDGEIVVSGDVVEPPVEPPIEPEPPVEPQPGEVIPFTQTQYPQSYYDPDNKIDEIKGKFEFLPRDANGWTIINPNPLKLVGYVDQILGDDDVAVLVPQGTSPASIVPFKTLDKALKALPSTNTNGELHSGAHHILLHDDQVFSTSIDAHTRIPSGDSHTDRLVIGRYGSGVKAPMIDDFGKGYIRLWGTCRYVIIQGVDCYDKYRDPASPDFWVGVMFRVRI